jgi:hypothetical protein
VPWLRLWVDILDDPDLCELSDGAFRGWTLMLAAAKKHGNGGTLPDEKRLLLWLRHPRATVDRWIEELVGAGLLEKEGESLAIHGWGRIDSPAAEGSWDETRRIIFRRDGYKCTYCGTTNGPFHCDHIIPATQGGSDEHDNLATACWKCNQIKNNRTPSEWLGR